MALIHQNCPNLSKGSSCDSYFSATVDHKKRSGFIVSQKCKEFHAAKRGRRSCERRLLLRGEGNSLLVYGNLDDLFLNRIRYQLSFVVNIELAHQVEFVRFHGFDAEAEDHRDLLH